MPAAIKSFARAHSGSRRLFFLGITNQDFVREVQKRPGRGMQLFLQRGEHMGRPLPAMQVPSRDPLSQENDNEKKQESRGYQSNE